MFGIRHRCFRTTSISHVSLVSSKRCQILILIMFNVNNKERERERASRRFPSHVRHQRISGGLSTYILELKSQRYSIYTFKRTSHLSLIASRKSFNDCVLNVSCFNARPSSTLSFIFQLLFTKIPDVSKLT